MRIKSSSSSTCFYSSPILGIRKRWLSKCSKSCSVVGSKTIPKKKKREPKLFYNNLPESAAHLHGFQKQLELSVEMGVDPKKCHRLIVVDMFADARTAGSTAEYIVYYCCYSWDVYTLFQYVIDRDSFIAYRKVDYKETDRACGCSRTVQICSK